MPGSKSRRRVPVFLILLSIYLLLPFSVTVLYSLVTEWSDILPTGFTFRNYETLLGDREFWGAIGRTLLICLVSVALTITVLLLVMYVVVAVWPRMGKWIGIVSMIPYALQGVILSIGIVSMYSGTNLILSDRMVMLFGAYSILVLPYIYQSIRNNLNSIPATTMMQAASLLGCGPFRAYWRILVPNIIPGILVSSVLAVSIIFGDFVLANNIAGTNYQNIQVYLFRKMSVSSGLSSAIVVVIFLVVLLTTGLLVYFQSKQRKEE